MDKKKDEKKEISEADSFFIKVPDGPQITSGEAGRSEQELLARYKAKGPRAETLKPLAIFYSRVGDQEKAYQYLKLWMKHAASKTEMSESLLMSGQLAEQVGQYEAAATFYKEGMKYKHGNKTINYFLNNNMAFCLNELGDYSNAMKYCEAAVKLDHSRANVYKNFGISLQGLQRYEEAAKIWLKALHVDISDTRPLGLLEKLMNEQGELIRSKMPDIDKQLESCRQAAASAQSGRFADWARGLTLN